MDADDPRRDEVIVEWLRWRDRQPYHRKWLIDEFHRWLETQGGRSVPSYDEVESWVFGHERWMT